MKADLPFVHRYRHPKTGKVYYYFRRPGFAKVRLPDKKDRAAFYLAYNEAMGLKKALINAPAPGAVVTVKACIAAYYQSPAYTSLGETSTYNYRRMLDRFAGTKGADGALYGDAPAAGLRPEHLRIILDPMYAATPWEAINLLKRLRAVFAVAVERDLIKSDPTAGVKLKKPKTDGFRAWTDADIERFREFYPTGSKPRIALEVLVYSGQRRSDVVKIGRQHVAGGCINLRQKKQGKGAEIHELAIPVHPNLQAQIDTLPADQLMFILTEYGKPRSEKGFTGWFSECAAKAGLPPQSSPHGLRKAAARWLAEAGCSASMIAAITGHQSLKDVEHYTKSADQKRLAKSAMTKLQEAR